MRAIRVHAYGGADALQLEEVPTPAPGPGQALVKIEAAGVNFIDVYQRSGAYKGSLPLRMGLEGAGVVEAVGPGVTGVTVGERVAWTGAPGSYASHNVVPVDQLVTVPAGLDTRTAAAVMLQGMTAHYLVNDSFPLGRGHTCLVHAAAGGVGLLLCQLAKRAGARAIGTTSTEEKAARAREAGASDVILYTQEPFDKAVRRLTGGAGVQVVYDSVGKDTFEKSLDSLAPRGRLILFGQSSGPVPAIDLQILNAKGSLFVQRPKLNDHTLTRQELLSRAGDVLGWVAAGALKVAIGGTYPLAQAAEAHRSLESRKTSGKLLLLP